MEHMESTMESLVSDISILLEMSWHQPQTNIVTLIQLSRVVLRTKNVIEMFEIKDRMYISVSFWYFVQNLLQLPVYIITLWINEKRCVRVIIRFWHHV